MNAPLLTRRHKIVEIPPHGLEVLVEADAEERAALAEEYGVPRIDSLKATLDVRHFGRGGLTVRGTLKADICQICVVSLDPFDSHIEEPIDVRFVPENSLEAATGEDDDDPPDVIVDGAIDLGTVVAEFFSLALDPYPRKPGVEFENRIEDDEKEASPFANLKAAMSRKPPGNDG